MQGPHQVAKKSTTTGPEDVRALKMTGLENHCISIWLFFSLRLCCLVLREGCVLVHLDDFAVGHACSGVTVSAAEIEADGWFGQL